ncbi:MAG: glycosyltransferase [Saccharofermentanales bacterium]
MKNVDIVILSWAKTEYLKNMTVFCIKNLFKTEKDINFNVFLLESNSGVQYKFNNNVHVKYMNESFGYHKFMNIGRKLGNSEYVVLCNNDLRFTKNWVSNIILEMEKDKDLLSACPYEPNTNKNLQSSGNIVYGYETRTHMNGWCIFQRRKIYDIIGDLDENFDFWCCDDDYGMSLRYYNIKHALIKNSVVHHENNGGKSLKNLDIETSRKYTNGGIQKFINKYGHLPIYMMKK